MESLNRMALELVDEALDFTDELNINAYELDNGATVLDFGIDCDGGFEAGLLLTEIQTAGLATVETRIDEIGDTPIPRVEVSTDHPGVSLLCSQKADWEIILDGFEGRGSGPARALVGEEAVFERIGYHDAFDFAVLTIESKAHPSSDVAETVANRIGIEPNALFLLPYPIGSVVGSVSSAGRAAEFAVGRLMDLGYDPRDIMTVVGSAPIAPVSYDEITAIGRTIDSLTYGSRVYLLVRDDFDRFGDVPSNATAEWGVPFERIFEAADRDGSTIPDALFGPAQVTIDVVDGPIQGFGSVNEELLAQSFGF